MSTAKKRPPRFDDIIALSKKPPLRQAPVSPFAIAYDAEEARQQGAKALPTTSAAELAEPGGISNSQVATDDRLPRIKSATVDNTSTVANDVSASRLASTTVANEVLDSRLASTVVGPATVDNKSTIANDVSNSHLTSTVIESATVDNTSAAANGISASRLASTVVESATVDNKATEAGEALASQPVLRGSSPNGEVSHTEQKLLRIESATVDQSTTVDIRSAVDYNSKDTVAALISEDSDVISTVDETTTVDKVTTVAERSTVAVAVRSTGRPKYFVDSLGAPVDPQRVRNATLVQHGHSPTEHIVYLALWAAGLKTGSGYREISIGYDKISRQTGIAKRNIQEILKRLHLKKSLDVIGAEISATRTGKLYRVYDMTAILERRRQAGLIWVVRHKGIDFVFPSTVADVSTVANRTTVADTSADAVAYASTDTVDDASTPLGRLRNKKEALSSEVPGVTSNDDSSAIAQAARRFVPTFDAAAVRQTREACREHTPDIRDDEIAVFVAAKCDEWRRTRRDFGAGLIITSVPKVLEGGGKLVELRQAGAAELRRRVEADRQLRELQAEQQRVLDDPATSEDDKMFARHVLGMDNRHRAEEGK